MISHGEKTLFYIKIFPFGVWGRGVTVHTCKLPDSCNVIKDQVQFHGQVTVAQSKHAAVDESSYSHAKGELAARHPFPPFCLEKKKPIFYIYI